MADSISENFNDGAARRNQIALDNALQAAAQDGDLRAAEKALLEGANVNNCTDTGLTPLHWAAAKPNPALVQLLIKHNADVNARNRNGATPLHFAAWHGQTQNVHILTNSGAKTYAQYRDGYRPLHSAMWRGHPETALALIDHGADPLAQSVHGETPFDLAIRNFQTETALKVREVISLRNSRKIKDIRLETRRKPGGPKPRMPAP